jgi:hypothetical protein
MGAVARAVLRSRSSRKVGTEATANSSAVINIVTGT